MNEEGKRNERGRRDGMKPVEQWTNEEWEAFWKKNMLKYIIWRKREIQMKEGERKDGHA